MLADSNDKVLEAGGDDIADELSLLLGLLEGSDATFTAEVLRGWGAVGDLEAGLAPRDRFRAAGPTVTRVAAVGIASLPAVLTPLPAFAGTPLPPNMMLAMAARPAAPPATRDVPPALAATGPQLFPFTRPMQAVRSQSSPPLAAPRAGRQEQQAFTLNPRLRSIFREQRKVAVTSKHQGTSVTFYRVRPGDSLYAIAREVLGSGARWREIYRANQDKVGAGYLLRTGQRLVINTKPAQAPHVAHAAPRNSRVAHGATGQQYKVVQGDSLYAIAAKTLGNANRWKEIVALNKAALHGRTTIYPNQWLTLPNQQA
ncbi:MAG: LysM peptidoglycan-binding domain-containing protein [Candidatus Sericytochromatia bacterium]|nr:LysM peptidoglycan-binding domain-containing protein [Candidatus Sericytochromatia bacterium]